MIEPSSRPFSVIVIGGGLAGLGAVQTLIRESQQQGREQEQVVQPIHITLLEAKDRLGGRVHSVSLKSATTINNDVETTSPNKKSQSSSSQKVADMGGMYFHGQGDVLKSFQESYPDWQTIASGGDSGLPGEQDAMWKVYTNNNDEDKDSTDVPRLESLRDLTPQERADISDLFDEWTEAMEERYQKFNNSSSDAANDSDSSIKSHPELMSKWSEDFVASVRQRLDGSASTTENNDKKRLQLLLQGLAFYWRLNFPLDRGVLWRDLAMNGLANEWDWEDYEGDDVISVHGMRALVDAMEKNLLEQTKVHGPCTLSIQKQTRVERIEYETTTTTSSTSSSSSSSCPCRIITSEDQSTLGADACICTIPLGVLRERASQLFVPPLPPHKLDAMQRTKLATLNTLVVQWSKPIHCLSIRQQQQQEDEDAPRAAASAYYMIGANENVKQSNPLWHGFVCPGVLRNQNDATITQFHFHETENIPFDDDLDFWKEKAVQVVRAVIMGGDGSDGSDSNASDELLTLDDIIDIHVSAWHLDPDILGSYSTPSTYTRGNVDRKILAESLPVGRSFLYFAGEHTHYEGRYQSMDGAYETGMRAARQVLQQARDHPHQPP